MWRVVLVSFFASFSFGQSDLAYRNYTLESGLSTNTVYEIYQHSNGKIYIGHENGCSIFNGLSFSAPKTAEKSTALSNFLEFQNGNVRCRNFQGVEFSIRNDSLQRNNPKNHGLVGFQTFMEDGDKKYVIFDSYFARIYENANETRITRLNELVYRFYHGTVLNDQAFFVATLKSGNRSLICFNLKSNKLEAEIKLEAKQNIYLFKTNNRFFWLDEQSGECGNYTGRFQRVTNVYENAIPKGSKITSFLELSDERKLICTFNGLYIFDKNWKLIRHCLDGIHCSNIIQDRDGALWIGSLQNGLFYVPNLDYLRISSSEIEGKNVKFSNAVGTPYGLFVGTYDGRILKFDESGQLVQTYSTNRKAEIQGIFVNETYLYAYCSRLIRINLKSGKIEKEWSVGACKTIYVENDRILCASSRGVVIVKQDELDGYLLSAWFRQVFPMNKSTFIAESTEEILIYDITQRKSTTLKPNGADLLSMKGNWYFRTDNEVFEVNDDRTVKKIYTSRIPIKELFASNGTLIVNLADLRSYQLSGEKFKTQRSLPSVMLMDISRTGEFGPYNFIANTTTLMFIPKDTHFETIPPRVSLLSEKGNFQRKNTIYELPYGENELILTFDIIPNYQFRGEGEIFYRIVELDSTWKKAVKNSNYTVEIIRIPPGDYTLEWYAKTINGSSKIERRSLCIEYPYYLQWWFLVCLLLVVVGISALIIRLRARRTRFKNLRKLEEQRLKMQALNSELTAIRSQMNPHFIFNSLSSIQTKILNEDRVEAYTTVNTFATLLRQALHFTSKEFITLENELDFTRNYIELERTRTANSFDYIETIEENLDLNALLIPSLFLQPFLENAIRHGLKHEKGDKKLSLQVIKIGGGFKAIIEDNGIGRKASYKINQVQRPNHTSFASKAILDRIDFLRESKKMLIKLKIEDLEIGTRVSITFKTFSDDAN